MTDELKPGTPANGEYEREDMQPSTVLYFLLVLGVSTVICILLLRGIYTFLDKHVRELQPPVSPLVTNVPEDTRHIAPGYPATAFPNPRLENDERGQLNGLLTEEQDRLYTYGWVDEKGGMVHIPIDRAMDLLVKRGLPVREQNGALSASGNSAHTNTQSRGSTKIGKGTAYSSANEMQ